MDTHLTITRITLAAVLTLGTCLFSTSAMADHGIPVERNPERGTSPDPSDELFRSLSSLKGKAPSADDEDNEKSGFNLRERVLRTSALSIGAQAGLYRETQRMQLVIDQYDAEMARIYNFRPLMIKDQNGRLIKPAVITEVNGEKSRNQNGQVLRVASKMFRIIRPPEFVLTPPYWREYLDLNFPKPVPPREALLPQNDTEQAIWKTNIAKGWKLGIEQAYQISEVRLAQLARDYIGMVRYHQLRDRRIVSEPVVDESYYPVSGGGDQLVIQDTILTIKATSRLEVGSDGWRPIPQLPDVEYLNIFSRSR